MSVIGSGTGTIIFGQASGIIGDLDLITSTCTGTGICTVNGAGVSGPGKNNQAWTPLANVLFSVLVSAPVPPLIGIPVYSLLISFVANQSMANAANWLGVINQPVALQPGVLGFGSGTLNMASPPFEGLFQLPASTMYQFPLSSPPALGSGLYNISFTSTANFLCSAPDDSGNFTVTLMLNNVTWTQQ